MTGTDRQERKTDCFNFYLKGQYLEIFEGFRWVNVRHMDPRNMCSNTPLDQMKIPE